MRVSDSLIKVTTVPPTQLSRHTRLRRALREANQKRLKCAVQVRELKARHVVQRRGARKRWKCPMCKTIVDRLTVAHVHRSALQVIDTVMKRNPRKGFLALDECVERAHRRVKLAVCCDKCNTLVATK